MLYNYNNSWCTTISPNKVMYHMGLCEVGVTVIVNYLWAASNLRPQTSQSRDPLSTEREEEAVVTVVCSTLTQLMVILFLPDTPPPCPAPQHKYQTSNSTNNKNFFFYHSHSHFSHKSMLYFQQFRQFQRMLFECRGGGGLTPIETRSWYPIN